MASKIGFDLYTRSTCTRVYTIGSCASRNQLMFWLPKAPLTHRNDGGGGGWGVTEVHILYPKKPQLQKLSSQKNHYFFLTYVYPKKSLSPFFTTQKYPDIFHRPKKITFGQNFRPKRSLGPPPPPIIKICELGPWVLAPFFFYFYLCHNVT